MQAMSLRTRGLENNQQLLPEHQNDAAPGMLHYESQELLAFQFHFSPIYLQNMAIQIHLYYLFIIRLHAISLSLHLSAFSFSFFSTALVAKPLIIQLRTHSRGWIL